MPIGPPTATATFVAVPPFLHLNRNEVLPAQWPLVIQVAIVEDAEIRIAVFNSAGEFVADLWNGLLRGYEVRRIEWYGTNFRGEPVSSNVYVVRLFSPKLLLLKKVAVKR